MAEELGTLLVRLRQRKGYTQVQVAERLCAASGSTTVTRHEVSRWERQERVPSAFWLRWLAEVLEVPMTELETAAGVARKEARTQAAGAGQAAAEMNGANVLRLPSTMREAPPAVGTPGARGSDGDPLSRVTIEFEHRMTSVRLSATYDDPRRAVSAIEAFPSMVGAAGPSVHGGAAQSAGQVVPIVQQQRPSPQCSADSGRASSLAGA